MNMCSLCGKIGGSCTAYLWNREKIEGLCKECKAHVERDALDNMTSECFEKLLQACNGGMLSELAQSMARTFQKQHRYLQGSFFTVLWEFFKEYGNADFDPRNKGAVLTSKKWYESL